MPYQMDNWMTRFAPAVNRANDYTGYAQQVASSSINPAMKAEILRRLYAQSGLNLPGSGGVFSGIFNTATRDALVESHQNEQDRTWGPIRQAIDAAGDPAGLNQLFNTAMSNLRVQQGQAVGTAQAAAGARAASGNLLNRGNFVVNSGNQARQPFVAQQGALEQSRAAALQKQKDSRVEMLLLLQKAMAGDELARQELQLRRDALNMNEADTWDEIAAFLPGLGQLASYFI